MPFNDALEYTKNWLLSINQVDCNIFTAARRRQTPTRRHLRTARGATRAVYLPVE